MGTVPNLGSDARWFCQHTFQSPNQRHVAHVVRLCLASSTSEIDLAFYKISHFPFIYFVHKFSACF